MTILKADNISEQQQTTKKMGNVNTKMTDYTATQKQQQSQQQAKPAEIGVVTKTENKVPKLEEYNVRVGPLAARPKNRIRLFVEDMLANATNTTCSAGRPLPPRKNLSLGDPTALGLDEALDRGQAQPRAGGLGREEGLEDPPPDLRTHADARVRDLDLEEAPAAARSGPAPWGSRGSCIARRGRRSSP